MSACEKAAEWPAALQQPGQEFGVTAFLENSTFVSVSSSTQDQLHCKALPLLAGTAGILHTC